MTCIAGLVADGVVVMGADAAGSDGWNIVTRTDAKIFRRGPYLIGFTTSFRMGQLLHFAGTLPDPPEDAAMLYGFMVTDFIEAVRHLLKDGGFAEKNNERESAGEFMVGANGRLFVVGDDYQVAEHSAGIAAIGSGYQIAIGALAAFRRSGSLDSHRDILAALELAEEWVATVRGPFTVLSLDQMKVLA